MNTSTLFLFFLGFLIGTVSSKPTEDGNGGLIDNIANIGIKGVTGAAQSIIKPLTDTGRETGKLVTNTAFDGLSGAARITEKGFQTGGSLAKSTLSGGVSFMGKFTDAGMGFVKDGAGLVSSGATAVYSDTTKLGSTLLDNGFRVGTGAVDTLKSVSSYSKNKLSETVDTGDDTRKGLAENLL